jgi:protein-S-isoprenylcysteine O-methyltransferase Ste14
MQTQRFGRLVAIPSPVFFALFFIAGLLVDRMAPWRPEWVRSFPGVGWILLMVGLILGPGSAALLGSKRTTLNPAGFPSRLVTDGTFRVTRNPMYLGLVFAYVALALLLGRAWPLLMLPAPVLLVNFLVIPFEEERMRETFGEEFAAYCRRVRRWI